jgi:CubicO group peptidase (beta-lactamase class C family)
MQPNEIDCPCTLFSKVLFADNWPSASQLAALQLIEKGKLQADSPVSVYLPIFENPVILDDFLAETPSFKPATKVVKVEHLLNFSSGLFYPSIIALPYPYTAKHDKEDPVGYFYNLIKVSLSCCHVSFVCWFIYIRAIYLLFLSNLNPAPSVGLYSLVNSVLLMLMLILVAYGYNSDTLGFIVEKITGQTLEEYW